jgi:hypothetical protein
MGNARKKKNFIHSLESDGEVVISQGAKHEAIYKHFLHHTGIYASRHCSLNFNELGQEARNLEHLDYHSPRKKSKGDYVSFQRKNSRPDGFIGLFFSSCWYILKDDLKMHWTSST